MRKIKSNGKMERKSNFFFYDKKRGKKKLNEIDKKKQRCKKVNDGTKKVIRKDQVGQPLHLSFS